VDGASLLFIFFLDQVRNQHQNSKRGGEGGGAAGNFVSNYERKLWRLTTSRPCEL
jgi:hypothetical protein